MISAGMPSAAVSKYKDLEERQRNLDDTESASSRATNDFTTARDVSSEASQILNLARSEEQTKGNEVSGRKQGIEVAEQRGRQFENEIKRLSDDIAVLKSRWGSLAERAQLLRWKYDRDLRNMIQVASLQIYCEQRNAGGEALRCFHAASMKLSAATLGIGSSAPVAYSPPRYFNVPEAIPQAPLAEEAEVRQSAREVAAQEEKLGKLKSDTEAADEIARAKKEHEEAKAEAQKAAAELADAEERARNADKTLEDKQANYTQKQEAARVAERAAREKQLEIQEDQAKEAAAARRRATT